jgi:nitric oxide reductase NorD protein
VQAHISGSRPQEYIRMAFAICNFTELLQGIQTLTKILITISDRKPDDCNDSYRGNAIFKDTLKTPIEAKRCGIHSFSITIDTCGRDYLPTLKRPANFMMVDEVGKLPFQVTNICSKPTV